MAPEQFDGMLSIRSDQYALACIAYEMVTGRNPFLAPSAVAMALKHKLEQPVAPTQFNTYLPVPVEQAILKAMSKERSERYPDVSAFIAALHMSSVQKSKEQWLDEGNQLYNHAHYQEALQAYERAIQLDPGFAEAHDARGDALFCLNHSQEALAAYERAIHLDADAWDEDQHQEDEGDGRERRPEGPDAPIIDPQPDAQRPEGEHRPHCLPLQVEEHVLPR